MLYICWKAKGLDIRYGYTVEGHYIYRDFLKESLKPDYK